MKIRLLQEAKFELGEGVRFVHNALPIGNFIDKRYGAIYVTASLIQRMVDNFGKFPSYEVPIKLGHGSGAARVGQVMAIEAAEDGLLATFDTDAETAGAIRDEKYKYMSAEYDEHYLDKLTGKEVGAVLLGIALTNQPAHPYMQPLVFAEVDDPEPAPETKIEEAEGGSTLTLEEMQAEVARIKAELEAEKGKTKTLSDDLEARKTELQTSQQQLQLIQQEKRAAHIKALCDGWVANGFPPVAVDKVRNALTQGLSVIQLGESEVDVEKLFSDVFEDLKATKAPFIQLSDHTATKELDARTLGDQIAQASGNAVVK